LAVDGFGCRIGQLVVVARQNARQMDLQGFSQRRRLGWQLFANPTKKA
jgi:hypothetical protein